ncbi:uncharacterized protein GGS22DRAFT_164563 [Annulohypoxylon maeteangense]|uniref:uncharacterized protein n=1 Tax=Annulohypoxylon maeteangense TaxID=1927788 RepID=UPI002007F215|nr:uncharacterized protein GGS22DRAFT_164563 [Annulohypoxylon maeteangense]KAI0884884.1 hypothetical protein GGS22DRAFT_164563 [Annulohypoxylon maeteangense]
MSSFGRAFIPIGLAVAFGILNGYYAFGPLLQEHQNISQLPTEKRNQQPDSVAKVNDSTQHKSSSSETKPNR